MGITTNKMEAKSVEFSLDSGEKNNIITPIILINSSKLSVITVEWNKPLYIPIPVSRHETYKLSHAIIPEYSNIIIATLLNNFETSRLEVTALTNFKTILLDNSITIGIQKHNIFKLFTVYG
jgi:hypothetical protein